MKRSRFLGLVLLSTGLAACAAAPQKGASPPPREEERDTETGEPGTDATGAQAPKKTPVAAARSELERAAAEVEAGLTECTSACRALASMERAAVHLCELDGAQECSSAKERVERARAKVKDSGCSCSK
jgi:hypothetical protein